MTAATVLVRAAAPTARAVSWTPLLALGGALLAVAALLRLRETTAPALVSMGAAAVAAALVLALRDPAASLLAPLPVSRFARRGVRLVEVAAVAVPLWLCVALLLPGSGSGLAQMVALASAGVAAATWLPVDRDVLPAAALPLVWATLAELVGHAPGVIADAADLWERHPWPVAAAGALLILLGRHR